MGIGARQRTDARPVARAVVPVVLAALALLPAACSGNEAGFGLPTEPADETLAAARTDLSGTLHVESDGCFTWQGEDGLHRWVVWPRGAGQDMSDGARVRVGGRLLGEGDEVAGSGTLAEASVLPGWSDENSYFGSFGRFCDADVRGIVVFHEVSLG